MSLKIVEIILLSHFLRTHTQRKQFCYYELLCCKHPHHDRISNFCSQDLWDK